MLKRVVAPTAAPRWSLSKARRASQRSFLRWAATMVALLVAVALSGHVLASSTSWLDAPIFHAVEAIRSPRLTGLARAVTTLGNGAVLAVIATAGTLGLALRRRPRSTLFLAVTSAGIGLISPLLKVAVARPRPVVLAHLVRAESFAFPSGHALASAAIFGAITVLLMRRFPRRAIELGAGCVALVGLIGISRVYLGVHYPSDVLAGWCLGFLWCMALEQLVL